MIKPLDEPAREALVAIRHGLLPAAFWADRDRGEGGPVLLHAEDVAELLGVTRDWVYTEARAQRIPHVRLGRYVRFRSESIEAWIKELEAGEMVLRKSRPSGAANTLGVASGE